jgi:outer membrane protein TolC
VLLNVYREFFDFRAQFIAPPQARYDMAVADYRQTVLSAFQQVEDGLAAQGVLSQEAQSQQSAVDASDRALDLAMNRYKGGAISYLDVVSIQTTALNNRRAAVDIGRRRMDASVRLLKAIGGGWQVAAGRGPGM